MNVKDLQARQGKVDITLDVVDVSAPRTFEKFGKSGKVANAIAKDETGDIKLSLWNEDCEKIKAGDKIQITNGYVSEWQGELQLGTGKFGKLEVIGSSEQETKEETQGPDEAANKKQYHKEMAKVEKVEQSYNPQANMKASQSKPQPKKSLEEDVTIEEEAVVEEEDVFDDEEDVSDK